MGEPVFTETMQIGIVVRDLDATVRRYVDDYGIGPWDISELTAEDLPDMSEYGKPMTCHSRIAITMVGNVMWELIQPLNEESLFARFLAEKGEGVHHIAVKTPNYDKTIATEIERGKGFPLSCTYQDIKIAYLDTAKDLGVLLEVFSGMPGER